MNVAKLIKTDDLGYRDGFLKCKCGWEKRLGNGFNGYHIASCPMCDDDLDTFVRNSVTTSDATGYNVHTGYFRYFSVQGIGQYHYQWDCHHNQRTEYDDLDEHDIKIADVVDEMVDSLEDALDEYDFSLSDVAALGDVNDLDELVEDGGEIRCEQFGDLADEFSLQFGEFDSMEQMHAHGSAVALAWLKFKEKNREG